MATHSKILPLTHPVQRRRTDPRIPHPSWRQTITGADQGAGRVVNAGDFWARLGI
jgi:hypothetical protein